MCLYFVPSCFRLAALGCRVFIKVWSTEVGRSIRFCIWLLFPGPRPIKQTLLCHLICCYMNILMYYSSHLTGITKSITPSVGVIHLVLRPECFVTSASDLAYLYRWVSFLYVLCQLSLPFYAFCRFQMIALISYLRHLFFPFIHSFEHSLTPSPNPFESTHVVHTTIV